MKKIIAIALFIFIQNFCIAQNVTQSVTFNADANDGYTIIGTVNKNLLIFLNTSEGYRLYTFNNKMEVLQYETLPYIIQPLISIHFFVTQNGMNVFYQCNDNGKRKIYSVQYNQLAKIVANPVLLDSNNMHTEVQDYDIQSSENKKMYFYSSYTNHKNNIRAILLNENLQKIDSTNVEVEPNNATTINYVSNGGKFMVVQKEIDAQNNIQQISILTQAEKNILNKDQYKYCLQSINNVSNELHLFLCNASEIKHVVYNMESNVLVSNNGISIADRIENFSHYIPSHVVLNSKKGFTILYEYFHFEQRTFTENAMSRLSISGMPMQNITTTKDEYKYGDVQCINVDSNQKIIWQKTIEKNQTSFDDNGQYAGFGLIKGVKNIKLLYNELENNNAIQVVNLLTDGTTSIETNNIEESIEGKLLCNKAKQINITTTIVPCIKQNKLSFVKLNMQ